MNKEQIKRILDNTLLTEFDLIGELNEWIF